MGDLTAVVLDRLEAVAGGDPGLLRKSEDELRALEVSDSYGVVLAEITSRVELAVHVRQLSSLVLKQYVQSHWSREGELFADTLVSGPAKQAIKKHLLGCLASEESKIRATVAYAIAAIATWEWPEEWPEFIDTILAGIHSANPFLVNGSMHVLEEFSSDVSDNQLPKLAPILIPELFQVVSKETYDLRTRCRAVTIFESLTSMVLIVADIYPEVKGFLQPWVDQYLAVFSALLAAHCSLQDLQLLPLLRDILSSVTQLLTAFPGHMSPRVASVLQPAWALLLTCQPLYLQHCVNGLAELPTLEGMLFVLFDFISALVELRSLQKALLPALPQLLHLLISYISITDTQLILWDDEAVKFLEDENDDLYSNSLRMSALDLVNSVASTNRLAGPAMQALVVAINKHLEEAEVAKQQGLQHWWKSHEACMVVMPVLAGGVSEGRVQYDLQQVVLQLALPHMMTEGVHPLLTGRCLWLCGKLVSAISPEVLPRCFSGCVTGIRGDQHMLIRICAVIAAHDMSLGLVDSAHLHVMAPFAEALLVGILELVRLDLDGIRIQVLEALGVLVAVAKEAVCQKSDQIVELCCQVFVKCCNDPGVLTVLEEVFSSLAQQPSCQAAILEGFASLVVKVLQPVGQSGSGTGLVAAMLDIWTQVVLHCPAPLAPPTVEVVYPAIVGALLKVDDSAILQSGGDCLKAYLTKGVEQLGAWSTTSGSSGLLLAVEVILHLLDPAHSEFSCSFLGPLAIVLIKQVGAVLGEHLESVVRSLLSKLHTVQSTAVTQSLLSVLCYLVHTQLASTLDFLEQVPDMSGRSALQFFLLLWTGKHDSFFGKWDTRLSSSGLAALILHYMTTGDPRLGCLETEGEEFGGDNRGIVTRSMKKAGKVEYRRITVPQKMVKLLIDDYQVALESAAGGGGAGGGAEWEDDSDGDEDEEGEGEEDLYSSLLGGDLNALCELESEGTEFSDDPLMQVDWKSYLEDVLIKCCQAERFSEILPALMEPELQTLRSLSKP
uniref:Importin-9 n=1 Tax=Halisarca dujardinii TaxID=2583056 RepID=A0AAU8L099_HALDU